MNTPAPRPALKRAADAHIHPAAPGHSLLSLRPALGDAAVPAATPAEVDVDAGGSDPSGGSTGAAGSTGKGQHRLSGPLRGTTSDSLRAATKRARTSPARKSGGKPVDLGVKVPKSLRKDFRAAAKADGKDPEAIVAALLKAWLGT